VIRAIAAALLALGISAAEAAELPETIAGARVRDPDASFFDIGARRMLGRNSTDPRIKAALPKPANCARALENRPPTGPVAVPRYYLSGSHGPVNPDHAAAERPYTRLEQAAAELAASYVAHGRPGDARCLIDLAYSWAEAGALLDYDARRDQQSWFTVEWTAASLGLALSIARAEPSLDQERRGRVLAWLERVVTKQIAYPGGPTSCCNNHYYWRGLQAVAAGVIIPSDDLFRWGLASWWGALGELNADGSFRLEMRRHERALHYQNFAVGPLVIAAELAQRQGIDLYALARGGRTMHDAVRFTADAIDDPGRVAKYADEPQYLKNVRPGSGDLAWMEFYHRRFPGAGLGRFLDKPLCNRRLGGAATFFAVRASDE
jgi:poly(beta-D-mannuronate) lyase